MSLARRYGSVESQIRNAGHVPLEKVVLDDVQHGLELTEDESSVLIYD